MRFTNALLFIGLFIAPLPAGAQTQAGGLAGATEVAETIEAAPGSAPVEAVNHPDTAHLDVLSAMATRENLSQFVSALQESERAAALAAPGPYIIFAPTNDAFAKMPEGALESLMHPESRADLWDMLARHIVPGSYGESALKNRALEMRTMRAERIIYNGEQETHSINGISIGAPIMAVNGVIYPVEDIVRAAGDVQPNPVPDQ